MYYTPITDIGNRLLRPTLCHAAQSFQLIPDIKRLPTSNEIKLFNEKSTNLVLKNLLDTLVA